MDDGKQQEDIEVDKLCDEAPHCQVDHLCLCCRTEAGIVHGGFVEAGICEAAEKLRVTVIQRMTLSPILINSRYLTCTTLVHGTTLEEDVEH